MVGLDPPFFLENMSTLPRTEFAQALKAIATERGLDADIILEAIKEAIVAAYRRDAREVGDETEEYEFDVELNSINGEARVFSWPEGKKKERKDVTPPGFGRIAAQTAKQVIHQKIREAEKGAIMDEFSGRVGTLISGMVLRFDGPDVRVDLGRTEGMMRAAERVPSEHLNANQRYTFLLKEIEETPRGKLVLLSRTDPQFVVKLFEREVPEMSTGSVEAKAVSREAGVRTKMAVFSNQSGVDPVGSCVGQKGVRVQAVTNELGGERVDIIPWSENIPDLIKAALSPAENLTVSLSKDGKEALVVAPDEHLSLAIGKDGQNARLASKLTGVKINVEGDGSSPEEVKKKEKPEKKEKKVEKKDADKTKEEKPKKKKTSSKVVKGKEDKKKKDKKEEKKEESEKEKVAEKKSAKTKKKA